jgi:transposase
MNYETAQTLNPEKFKRRFGVQRSTFKRMVKGVKAQIPELPHPGRPPKLSIEDQILVALEYWREYRTYFHIATDKGVSESTVCRIVHRIEDQIMASGLFRIPGKKQLVRGFGRPELVVVDVTETPIERPKKKQKVFYSGKQKQHTLKCQVIIDRDTFEIICLYFGPGRTHDFKVFKASGIHIHPDTGSLGDSGYQGIARFHANSYIPKKKPRNGELSEADRDYNRTLGQERIWVEHVNRRLKIFRILAQRYRNRRRRYGLRCNLIAALHNYELNLV